MVKSVAGCIRVRAAGLSRMKAAGDDGPHSNQLAEA